MKNKRQAVIIELIQNNVLTTQDELLDALKNIGYEVTQSTVSRDIKELRIVKAQDSQGIYRYLVAGKNNDSLRNKNHFEDIFSKSCIDVVYSQNTVVIKCYAGMASSVCVALDNLFSGIILGSLAGDDTIFAITSGESDSIILTEKIKKLI